MSTTEYVKELGQRILKAHVTMDHKILMLTWLKDNKPPIFVEAELTCNTLFLGFIPDPSVHLAQLITGSVKCVPRSEIPTEDQAQKYVEIIKKLKNATQNGIHALAQYKTKWADDWGEIIWYDFFTDKVSLRFADGGYSLVNRKDLFYGSAEAPNTSAS